MGSSQETIGILRVVRLHARRAHEISWFFKQSGRVTIPLTVQEILDEEIAHKLA